MQSCTPLHDRVLIRPIDVDEETSGGIIIPDVAKAKPREGEVVAVGPGKHTTQGVLIEPSVRVGNRVIFGEWAGTTKIKVDGEELMIMREEEVLAVRG